MSVQSFPKPDVLLREAFIRLEYRAIQEVQWPGGRLAIKAAQQFLQLAPFGAVSDVDRTFFTTRLPDLDRAVSMHGGSHYLPSAPVSGVTASGGSGHRAVGCSRVCLGRPLRGANLRSRANVITTGSCGRRAAPVSGATTSGVPGHRAVRRRSLGHGM
jgi:hypothetical protein